MVANINEDVIPPVALPFTEDEDESNEKRKQVINRRPLLDEKNDAPPMTENGKDAVTEKAAEGRTRRLLLCGVLLLLLCAACALAIWFFFRGGAAASKPAVKVTTDPNKRQDVSYTTDDEKYNAALKSLAGKTGSPDNPLGPPTTDTGGGTDSGAGQTQNELSGLPKSSTFDSKGAETERVAINDTGGNIQPELSNAPALSESNARTAPSQTTRTEGAATAGRSTLFSASRLANRSSNQNWSSDSVTSNREGTTNSEAGVTIPPFGAMLPVRSLGVIYTLRSSGSLVRFELTRDMSGRGWKMRKGTVLVGVVRSSELDRAFVSMVGFIDAERGGLVKVTGDLLSGDGASGIKGKRRKVSSGFSRVLGKISDAGLGILSNLASGVGRGGTVIISDAYSRGVAPITSELDGVINNRQEFIEIKAGTPCYVMVTQLPDEIQGVDALAGMSDDSLASLSDSSSPRRATGISESELAELLSRGNEAEIRRALPRMTPEMRRLAEAVLREGGGR